MNIRCMFGFHRWYYIPHDRQVCRYCNRHEKRKWCRCGEDSHWIEDKYPMTEGEIAVSKLLEEQKEVNRQIRKNRKMIEDRKNG